MTEPRPDTGVQRPVRKLNPTMIALLGGLVILLLLVAYFATRDLDQDKLSDEQIEQQTADQANPEKRCAAKATYDAIKRDLFRRAAQLRGSDQAAFDRLAAYAVLRMENPVLESEPGDSGTLSCSGSLSLDLPPGVAVVGGRRSLTANVEYTLRRAADGSGDVVLLRNADAIIAPLATLARTSQPAPPTATAESNMVEPGEPVVEPAIPDSPAVAPAPPRPSAARPSFNCDNARTAGEVAVCSDAGLAALDRNMAAQFSRSMAAATPAQRALLQSTRGRFLAFRDRCPNRACIGDAYTGRMREIRDIMEGRWQPR